MPQTHPRTHQQQDLDGRIVAHDPADAHRVVVVDEIDAGHVRSLSEGEILAIIVPAYYDERTCAKMDAAFADPALWTTYAPETGAADISTAGPSLFGCLGAELCPEYVQEGRRFHRILRQAVMPYVYPVDRVQNELDHVWPSGAQLLRLGEDPAFSGLVRRFQTGGEAMAHQDNAAWDYASEETARLISQCFINVYLRKTQAGGTVKLWDRRVATPAEYDHLRVRPGHYALDEARIEAPVVEIDPPVGALLLANASKVHAVTPCAGDGVRTSVSAFFGYSGPDRPLRVFS